MQKDLVSILTPCYNTGAILYRLFDSILMQDYPSIEMFAINDGSTDNTEEVIKSYIPKFDAKGYKLTYIYQENSGQSAAINNGLKLVNGDFLIWPDSDDFFNSDSTISIFVSELKNRGNDFAIVRSLPTFVSEKNRNILSHKAISPEIALENQFLNCLYSENFIWPPVNYMIRTEAFDQVNPKREIYVEKNAGQNWQMLLPLLFSYKCITINKNLCSVLVRESSHSRGGYSTYEQVLKRISSYRNTLIRTLDSISFMPDSEKLKYKKEITEKYKLQELELSVVYGYKKDEYRLISELKAEGVAIPYNKLRKIKMRNTKLGKVISFLIKSLRCKF